MAQQFRDPSLLQEFPKELEPYKGLIFCPLDLPEPPEIDEARLFAYIAMRDERDRGTLAGSVSGATGPIPLDHPWLRYTASWSKEKDTYPWRLLHLMRSDFANDGWEYYPEFKEWLPELAAYFESLPVSEFYTMSLLNQKAGTDVGIHTDPDVWFGLRFYAVNRSNARIFFQKAKNPSAKRLLNLTRNADGTVKQLPWSDFVEDEKVYGKYPCPRFPFHLTTTHAAHGVEAVPEGDTDSRVTGFVICRVRPKEYAELLARSVEKYKDYAIWW
jgi:hypothetical protein